MFLYECSTVFLFWIQKKQFFSKKNLSPFDIKANGFPKSQLHYFFFCPSLLVKLRKPVPRESDAKKTRASQRESPR